MMQGTFDDVGFLFFKIDLITNNELNLLMDAVLLR